MKPTTRATPKRVLGAAGIVFGGFCLILGILFFGISTKSAANRDFVEYWAAAQQLVHGANPYDSADLLHIERAVGMDGDQPKISFSPPAISFLLLPLGMLDLKVGMVLWSLAVLLSLSLSILLLWILNGRPESRLHLLGYVFAPALACLMAGQLGTFFLLSVVLFLYLHSSYPLAAGAVLLPCVVKPHLFLPFAIALLLWIVVRSAYRILIGFSLALLASCALTLHLYPRIWTQYARMMSDTRVLDWFVPTLSATLRLLVAPAAVWVQFVFESAACIWAVWYFWTRRKRWDWMNHGLLLLLVSVACAPYAWISDEALLLPAILAGVYRAIDSRRSLLPFGIFTVAALVEVLSTVRMTSCFYLWTAPAWLAWYLYATYENPKPTPIAESVEPDATGFLAR